LRSPSWPPLIVKVGITVGDRKISNIFGIKPAALPTFRSAPPDILRLTLQADWWFYGPAAFGILHHRPNKQLMPDFAFERAYHKIDEAFDEAISLLAA
jgi:hypothetical protein